MRPWWFVLSFTLGFVSITAGCESSTVASRDALDAATNDTTEHDETTIADAETPDGGVVSDVAHITDVTDVTDATDTSDAIVSPPVAAPPRQWTWVPVDGAQCADGSPTGFGVNLADNDPTRVVIFLQGGGACWDDTTCLGPVPTSFYVTTGYGRLAFETDPLRPVMLPLQRGNPLNPWRDTNLVYVPYCTGDVHAGDRVTTYSFLGRHMQFHHVGARNLDLYLQRIVATFPHARRVWLMGDSAGGFGAALNMDRVQRAFSSARVDVVDDSGQPVQPAGHRWADWRNAWNLQLPVGCTHCEDIGSIAEFLRTRYSDNRFALVSYTHDSVISTFMGMTVFEFNTELEAFARTMTSRWVNGRYFFIPGALHVGFATATPALATWLTAFATDDPAWQNHRGL